MKTASWVIIDITTKESMMETYLKRVVDAINKEKYCAIPILEYLCSLNKLKSNDYDSHNIGKRIIE